MWIVRHLLLADEFADMFVVCSQTRRFVQAKATLKASRDQARVSHEWRQRLGVDRWASGPTMYPI